MDVVGKVHTWPGCGSLPDQLREQLQRRFQSLLDPVRASSPGRRRMTGSAPRRDLVQLQGVLHDRGQGSPR